MMTDLESAQAGKRGEGEPPVLADDDDDEPRISGENLIAESHGLCVRAVRAALRGWPSRRHPDTAIDYDDLVQQVHLKVWQHRDLFSGKSRGELCRFIYVVAHHVVCDSVRKVRRRKCRREVVSRPTEALDALASKAGASGEEEVMERDAFGEASRVISRHYPPVYQEVVHLRYVVGLTIREIASLLDRSTRTVERMLTSARAVIAKEYRD
jgi:RNA polymerase sigma factor (sigma-70 family)